MRGKACLTYQVSRSPEELALPLSPEEALPPVPEDELPPELLPPELPPLPEEVLPPLGRW